MSAIKAQRAVKRKADLMNMVVRLEFAAVRLLRQLHKRILTNDQSYITDLNITEESSLYLSVSVFSIQ